MDGSEELKFSQSNVRTSFIFVTLCPLTLICLKRRRSLPLQNPEPENLKSCEQHKEVSMCSACSSSNDDMRHVMGVSCFSMVGVWMLSSLFPKKVSVVVKLASSIYTDKKATFACWLAEKHRVIA